MFRKYWWIMVVLPVMAFMGCSTSPTESDIPGSYLIVYQSLYGSEQIACKDYYIAEDGAVVTTQGYWEIRNGSWEYVNGVKAMYIVERIWGCDKWQ